MYISICQERNIVRSISIITNIGLFLWLPKHSVEIDERLVRYGTGGVGCCCVIPSDFQQRKIR